MIINNDELKKIFDFILINKNIPLSNYGLFSRDTLIILRDIIKGKRPNDFNLSEKRIKILIRAFLTSNSIFDENTPKFILMNPDCINIAVERDVNSVNYVSKFTPELEKKVIYLAIKNKYILSIDSPLFLKRNYIVSLNSIRQDVNSANFIDWNSFSKEDYDSLIKETINAGYRLSSNSCSILKENIDIVIESISKDIKTADYVPKTTKSNPKVFKYLLLNGYDVSDKDFYDQSLSSYADLDIMKYALQHFQILSHDNKSFSELSKKYPYAINKYIDRFSRLFSNAIMTIPTINSFNGIFQYSADVEWEDYRNENLDDFANVFGKICGELQTTNNFKDALDNLCFLPSMKKALDDRYNLLIKAMEQYHMVIHSTQKLDNIDLARNQIAKLSSLYVSISKDNFKKEQLEEYEELIFNYFIPRKDNPFVYKKIIEKKQKNVIKKLYHQEDKIIYNFLEDIVRAYSSDIEKDTLWQMIDNFISNDYSKMDAFIKAPRGFNNYKRYEEACKLINRLNSKYIKYTDQELVRYLDIIKYDFSNDKYYYIGPSFNNEQVSKYTEYRKKQRIFEKIKKQIIFKARTMKISEEITREELVELKHNLPFNDEYYEFDKYYFTKYFNFEDFIDSCIVDNDIIEPISLLDDETYNVLCNYVINNGLIWLLLFLNSGEDNDLEAYFDKESLLDTMDYMEEIVRLSKILNYDLNKYEDIVSLEDLGQCADDEAIAILSGEIIEKLSKDQTYTNNDTKKIITIAKELVCQMVKRTESTVPYVKGQTMNYVYSLYDSQDEEILLSGINTNACFRVDGVDNDFLHYCVLNKNGFVIKITDILGNFIARASGFRNGNSVYINQLRTIYDEGGEGYEGRYDNEKAEIIETFKKACDDIVETSQKNKDEKDKIDFVFVTKSYAMSGVDCNVSRAVQNRIGDKPMVSDSDDWKNFVRNTNNLHNCSIDEGFSTDYGNYSLICVASKKILNIFNRIDSRDIKPKDVQAVYTRKRNNIIITDMSNVDALNKINRINGIYSYLNNCKFEGISIPNETLLFVGDNWYIAYLNGDIKKSLVLDFDKKAQIEYEATKRVLEEYKKTKIQQINIEQISQQLNVYQQSGNNRVLRLNY